MVEIVLGHPCSACLDRRPKALVIHNGFRSRQCIWCGLIEPDHREGDMLVHLSVVVAGMDIARAKIPGRSESELELAVTAIYDAMKRAEMRLVEDKITGMRPAVNDQDD